MLAQAEMKIYIVNKFCYSYMDLGTTDPKVTLNSMLQQLEEATMSHLRAYSFMLMKSLQAIKGAHFKSCDPIDNTWIEDESFYNFDGLYKSVLFAYQTGYTADQYGCENILKHSYEIQVSFMHKRNECPRQMITGCSWVGDKVHACILYKGRRTFDWIETSNFGKQGKNYGSCPGNKGDELIIPTSIFHSRISACQCDCFQRQWTIYLKRLGSKERNNNVITGMRFKRKGDTLFLQPAEGKLEANGKISNFSWVPLPENIQSEDLSVIDIDRRSFFLDDVHLGLDYVLTGIRFIKYDRGAKHKIKGYTISISGVPFNYATGQLDLSPANKKSVTIPEKPNFQGNPIYKKVSPLHTKNKSPTRPSPKASWMMLEPSDLTDDFGQSTIPLLDCIPITTNQPLNGMGLFHKGSKDHSGFIALRLHPINYLQYLERWMERYQETGSSTPLLTENLPL